MLAANRRTMTDSEYQRQGLFVSLAEKRMIGKKRRNSIYLWLPNEASHPGFMKLGWRFLPDSFNCSAFRSGTVGPLYFPAQGVSSATTDLS